MKNCLISLFRSSSVSTHLGSLHSRFPARANARWSYLPSLSIGGFRGGEKLGEETSGSEQKDVMQSTGTGFKQLSFTCLGKPQSLILIVLLNRPLYSAAPTDLKIISCYAWHASFYSRLLI